LKSHAEEQKTIRRYLLGLLPSEDLPPLEERLLTDAAFYEELLIVEDELIDQYLSGELPESERASFETHFLLAPERQERVRFARTLKKYMSAAAVSQSHEDTATEESSEHASEVAEPPPKKRPFFSFLPFQNPIISYSLAAAMILIVGGVSWVIFKNWKSPVPREPGKVLAVELTPGLTRDGGEMKKIAIPPGTNTVQLDLKIASVDQYQSYRAVLQTTDGVEKFRITDLKATTTGTSAVVSLRLAAGLLARGDYEVKLSGLSLRGDFEDVNRYFFRITGP
jgi:hypothetical protein